ncbi:upstream activation factor subunit UAF30 [Cryptococcus deuterogattii R265]|uniref:Upstream activation factor subunit UAF30 n=1 Tax=Cryptococcus deuterogattii (strain R265) TaxID=294750 RepID=A0A095CA65_CRYD2|nr:upstream activation factor subunit UAF30 [Cryptococcus deuterogattii R265]KIR24822.1 upstream activation factor subunit UAF30 [Cryptococcus deuterogattii LA55]KIR37107.1 upstream activation factor subunit UAF30 [Cryptococcus deuterogattii MMRL2647]KIR74911.1 upstream activation factor subunit UAF30 [Cryptococcus deuterogattii CA1014]KIR92162.1 upstream activation factor subunit UAF30 [Cryptococcus deuterogattii CBS 10090]KIS01328.1 upstream activation factor subunit UAF30 [Cryptococcus deut
MAQQLVHRLSPLIEELLQASDLSTVSAKAIRKELIARGADKYEIKNFRAEIDDKITEIYNSLESKEALAHKLENSVSPSAKASSSPSYSTFEPKTVTRKRKIPVSENEETDEQMAKRLQGEYDGSRTRQQRSSRSARPAKKTRRKSQAHVDSEERNDDKNEDKKKKRGGAFNKELLLSGALADLVGTHSLSRPQVVKHIWAYVKERNLQDSNDKRYILCDDKLREIFHTDRLHMFTMNKILVNHLRDPDDIA